MTLKSHTPLQKVVHTFGTLSTTVANHLSFLGCRKQWIKGCMAFGIVYGGIFLLEQHVCLLFSSTDSLPQRTFLMFKKISPVKGSYTCVHSPWYGSAIIKKIVGTAGDTLSYDNEGNLWVGRQLKVGKPKKQSKDGKLLTPIEAGVIPEGMVFITGSHERSFDSRYQELGLIPEKHLQGRVIALM